MQVSWNKTVGKPMLAKLWRRVESGTILPEFTPEEVSACCDEFLSLFPDAHAGGGHITLADDNTESDHIGFCIRQCIEDMGTANDRHAAETIHFLGCLLCLDEDERVMPDPADDWHIYDNTDA